jgi:hypothetical protein
MAKRNLMVTSAANNVAKEDILLKTADIRLAILALFSRYQKKTDGAKSIADAGIDFALLCAEKVPLYPEILSATFEKDDFLEKIEAIADYRDVRAVLVALLDDMDKNVKGIKTDVLAYANEYYGIIQREAERKAKYRTDYDQLKPFYKKSKTKLEEAGKNGATAAAS